MWARTGCTDLAVHRAGEADVLAPQANAKASAERGLGHALGGSAKAIALPSAWAAFGSMNSLGDRRARHALDGSTIVSRSAKQ
jgi:hypothetical protein